LGIICQALDPGSQFPRGMWTLRENGDPHLTDIKQIKPRG